MPTSPTAGTLTYANFAAYVAQTMFGAPSGSVPGIPNDLASSQLGTSILLDPLKIDAYRDTIASQMNAQSGGPRFTDLTDRIGDVVITTSAQGASTLEVSIIDPLWVLPQSGFIQADEFGYLQPLDIQFPSDTSMVWRLCQYRPSWSASMTAANLVLTFEDRIVSALRLVSPGNGGVQQGQPNQTLIAFFQQLVTSANGFLHGMAPIQLVPLISPQDPNATVQVTEIPARAAAKLKPVGVPPGLKYALDSWQQYQNQVFGGLTGQGVRIRELEQAAAGKIAQLNREAEYSGWQGTYGLGSGDPGTGTGALAPPGQPYGG